jgi:hypothetical protein
MRLREFKALLQENREKAFQIQLPQHGHIPESFHVTEVAQVNKTFIDCGGKIHSIQTCQLQIWVGEDVDHRLETGKLADILALAQKVVPDDDIDLEIEYEDAVISQYPIERYLVTEDAVVLSLTTRHTDCLAKELCVLPACCGTASEAASCC